MRKSGMFSAQGRQKGQRKRQNSNRFRSTKQQLRTYSTLLRTFICRHYMTTTVKFPHGTLYGGSKLTTTNFFFSPSKLGLGPKKPVLEKLACIWHLKRVETISKNFEEKRKLFYNDVFAAVTVVVALIKAP